MIPVRLFQSYTPTKKYGIILYKSSRNVLGPRGACSPVGKNISDDNRYEHGAV